MEIHEIELRTLLYDSAGEYIDTYIVTISEFSGDSKLVASGEVKSFRYTLLTNFNGELYTYPQSTQKRNAYQEWKAHREGKPIYSWNYEIISVY